MAGFLRRGWAPLHLLEADADELLALEVAALEHRAARDGAPRPRVLRRRRTLRARPPAAARLAIPRRASPLRRRDEGAGRRRPREMPGGALRAQSAGICGADTFRTLKVSASLICGAAAAKTGGEGKRVGNMKVDASAMERKALLDSARKALSPEDMDVCVLQLLFEGCRDRIFDLSPMRYVETEKEETSRSNVNAMTADK